VSLMRSHLVALAVVRPAELEPAVLAWVPLLFGVTDHVRAQVPAIIYLYGGYMVPRDVRDKKIDNKYCRHSRLSSLK
jgi:hypothetical protein